MDHDDESMDRDDESMDHDDEASVCSNSSIKQESDRISRWQDSIAKDPPNNKIIASAHVDDCDIELLCAYLANMHNATI